MFLLFFPSIIYFESVTLAVSHTNGGGHVINILVIKQELLKKKIMFRTFVKCILQLLRKGFIRETFKVLGMIDILEALTWLEFQNQRAAQSRDSIFHHTVSQVSSRVGPKTEVLHNLFETLNTFSYQTDIERL